MEIPQCDQQQCIVEGVTKKKGKKRKGALCPRGDSGARVMWLATRFSLQFLLWYWRSQG